MTHEPTASDGSNYVAAYVQDDWRVKPSLTLNLGLRWDLDTPRTERYNRLSYWDPSLPSEEAAEKAGANGDKKFYLSEQDLHGTVGAVALDRSGNLAAATSTGGKTGKLPGRVGDTPVIGAGTYANNATCAVSGTGDGEFFIMATAAHDVSAIMEYKRRTLPEASIAVIDKIAKLGGTGGMIAIDKSANIAMPFNTSGMYRGYVDANGKFVTEIFR